MGHGTLSPVYICYCRTVGGPPVGRQFCSFSVVNQRPQFGPGLRHRCGATRGATWEDAGLNDAGAVAVHSL